MVFIDVLYVEKDISRKLEKYNELGFVIPIVVASLGFWFPNIISLNNELTIPGYIWHLSNLNV